MGISENYLKLRQEIPSSVTLVIAVKYASLEQIRELLAAGCRDIGFNTLQQMESMKRVLDYKFPEKISFSSAEEKVVRIHFIGHLQSNKIKKVLDWNPYLIQSVDSLELAEKIAQACKEKNRVQNILLQVKTDPGKEHGFLPQEVMEMAVKLHRSPRLKVLGLMTLPALMNIPIGEKSREPFRLMKRLFDELQGMLGRAEKLPYLSMGMSKDYQLALAEGATLVRVGRKVFE